MAAVGALGISFLQVHAAASPNIVDAIAAAELPSMNSGNSDDSIGEHHNKTH